MSRIVPRFQLLIRIHRNKAILQNKLRRSAGISRRPTSSSTTSASQRAADASQQIRRICKVNEVHPTADQPAAQAGRSVPDQRSGLLPSYRRSVAANPAIYGALESVEDTSNVDQLILNFIDSLTRVED